jgi:hypothetical protein
VVANAVLLVKKRCPRCGETDPANFHRNARNPDGLASLCKQCMCEAVRKSQHGGEVAGLPARRPSKPRRRMSRQERIAGSILGNEAVIAVCRRRMRRLVGSTMRMRRRRLANIAELAEATVRVRRLREIQARIAEKAA